MMVLKLDMWLDLPVAMTSAIHFHLWPVQTCGTLTVWTGWRRGKGLWHHAKAPTCGLKILGHFGFEGHHFLLWFIIPSASSPDIGLQSHFNLSETKLLQDLLSKAIHCYRQSCFSHSRGVSLTGRMKRPQRRVNGNKKPKLSDAQTAQIASTQEQAAQLIASMVGPALGFLLNICRVVLLHCAALHSIQFPRFCMSFVLA